MLIFRSVTDAPPSLRGVGPMLLRASVQIPEGRYALLASDNAIRRPVVDLMTGTRAPERGRVYREGRSSWAIGRPAFMRGRSTGNELLRLIARLYHLDHRLCEGITVELLSRPDRLDDPIQEWDSASRLEFNHAISLLPNFDLYIVDGVLPSAKTRFAALWNVLFRKRIEGKVLILSTSRAAEAFEFCDKALIIHDGQIRISDQLEQSIDEFPPRPILEPVGASTGVSEPVINDDF